MQKPHLSIVIPLYNEEEVFSQLVERLDALVNKIGKEAEIVLVDDGSADTTPLLIHELALKDRKYQSIYLSRNFGQQKALSAGLDFARGDYIMFLDADLQDPPEMYFDFITKIKEGYDVVYGIRTNRKEGVFKKILYKQYYKLLEKVSNHPIPKDSGDFSLISRKVADAMNTYREDSRFLRGVRSWVGFKQIGVPYERNERAAGVPKYTMRKLLRLGFDGIFNFTTLPIKTLIFLGTICILTSVIYFAITLVRKYWYEDVPSGFTALLFVVMLFGGLQFLSLGIIGEYIQRTFFQVKNRPLYLIRKRIIDGEENLDE